MRIKPPDTGMPAAPAGGPEKSARPATGRMREARPAEGVPAGGLPGVAARFRLSDLRDPSARDGVLRAAVSELVDRKLEALGAGNVGPAQRQQLESWLRADPTIQRLLERYLEGALK